jgi:MFS family permease
MSTPAPPADPPPLAIPVPLPARRWLPATFRALRHRNYRLYFVGQIVSLTGSWLQTAALTWLAYDLTRQSRWPALVGAAQVLPALLLGVWGGSLADRWPRRTLIVLTQSGLLLLALLLAGMIALGAATPWGLLAASLLIGVVNAIDTPARLAFVIDMVGRDDLINAVALNSLIFNLARALGPACGAVLLPALGPGPCFLLNGLTFAAVLAALAAMRLPRAGPRRLERPAGSLLDSLRSLARRRDLVLLVALAAALAFFGWPLQALLPALSDQRLGAGEAGYAWMLSGIGGGALVGALLVASYGSLSRRRAFLGAGVVVGVAALLGLAVTKGLPVAVLSCALSGCGLILFFATGQAMMQLGADEHNRGRVMGIWLAVLSGAAPAGNLATGFFADCWGVQAVLLGMAGGITLAGAGVLLLGAVLLQGQNGSGVRVERNGDDDAPGRNDGR